MPRPRRAPIGGRRPPLLDRESALPLWAQLVDDLQRRLAAGEYAGAFPSELELCSEYEVSRHTVREALRRLRESGMLESSRGRSTRVRRGQIEQSLGALYSLFSEIEARGMVQRSEVLELDEEHNPDIAARLWLPADTPLLHLVRLRLADDEPLALDRTWLPAHLTKGLREADLSHTGLYDELAARCGLTLTGGREVLSAVVPSRDDRSLLQLPRGAAALSIQRTGCLEGRPLEWRWTLIRGDRFAVSAEWSRRTGYRLGAPSAGATTRGSVGTGDASDAAVGGDRV